jgi:hypothetical protein
MSMFGDLIPKAKPPQPPLPSDPWTGAGVPRPRLTAGSNTYGQGQIFPTDAAIPSAPTMPDFSPFEGGMVSAPAPMIEDQIRTPSIAELVASGGMPPRAMTSQDRAQMQSRLRQGIADVDGAPTLSALFTSVLAGLQNGDFASPIDAEQYALNPENWAPETKETVTNPPGTMLSRLFGLDDGIPDAVEQVPTGRSILKMPQQGKAVPQSMSPDQVLQEARDAIAAGKDPQSVKNRLIEMGIYPANL